LPETTVIYPDLLQNQNQVFMRALSL